MRPDREDTARLSFDVVLLFVLLLSRVRIDTLAEWAAIPSAMLHADVARLLQGVLSPSALTLLSDRQTTDPVTLLLISLSFGCFLLYAMVDLVRARLTNGTVQAIKMVLVSAIIALLVIGQTVLFIGLRHISGPASYTHDGGVIQTEVTISYFTQGINPYVADYLDTPMAEWGTEYRTALYHYPYLPWTFVFSTPFFLLSKGVLGWYDQRFVYLLLFLLTLVVAGGLTRNRRERLLLVMILGLNPILASDMIFGQNDAFVLSWLVFGVWFLRQAAIGVLGAADGRRDVLLAAGFIGLAFASKPTSWFVAPFLVIYLLRDYLTVDGGESGRTSLRAGWLRVLLERIWPLLLVLVIIVGPWLVWNAPALYEDVWGWSSGTAEVPYQIRGWGLSNFVLAFELVPDRLAYWPFWTLELVVGGALLALLGWRQLRHNTLSSVLHHYVILLLAFLFVSRFLNENYLGFAASLMAVAYFIEEPTA
jgi:hypothetical protein